MTADMPQSLTDHQSFFLMIMCEITIYLYMNNIMFNDLEFFFNPFQCNGVSFQKLFWKKKKKKKNKNKS